jgi:spore coat polysaccharide biosynthesis predicted glycosyltransferase SpsG
LEPDIAVVIYPHKSVRARLRDYVGLEFQIIRDEIVNAPRLKNGIGVVIVLGGGDLLGQGHLTAAHLAQLGLRVSLIQGPLAKHREPSELFEVIIDPPDLAIRLVESDWVITNGGTCMFESMCLGKATFVLPQTRLEKPLAEHIWKLGGILGLGREKLTIPKQSEKYAVARKAVELIDGRGAIRVAKIIEGLL